MSQPDHKAVHQRGDKEGVSRNDRRHFTQTNKGLSETHRGAKRTYPKKGPQGYSDSQ